MNDNDVERYVEREIESYSDNPKFVAEGYALSVAEEISLLISEIGLNQTKLANAMGVSRSHVSQLLNAPSNMTLLTLARLGIAFGVVPTVRLDGGYKILPAPVSWADHEDQITEYAYSGADTQSTINAFVGGPKGYKYEST